MRSCLALSGHFQSLQSPANPNEVTVLRGHRPDAGHAGRVVALVAPSGAGKSTLLHIARAAGYSPNTGHGRDCRHGHDRANATGTRARTCGADAAMWVSSIVSIHLLARVFGATGISCCHSGQWRGFVRRQKTRNGVWIMVGVAIAARTARAEVSGGEAAARGLFGRALANAPSFCWRMRPTGNLDPNHLQTRLFRPGWLWVAAVRPLGR